MAIQRRHLMWAASAAGAAAFGGFTPLAAAQTVENLRVLVSFPPGGTADAVARLVAERLRGTYARTIIVENRAGAAGRLAVEELRRSTADGTTMLATPTAVITLNPHVHRALPFGPTDLTPVAMAARFEHGFGVGPAVPAAVRDLRGFLDWARVHPAQASYGTPGVGSSPHLIGALLARDSGVALRHVPFRGGAPAIQDLLGGHIPAAAVAVGEFLAYLREGRLRLLATSGPTRSPFAPDIPTFTEQGFPNVVFTLWMGFFIPNGTPAATIEAAAHAIRLALGHAEVVDGLARMAKTAAPTTPTETAAIVRDEHATWGRVVARVGFTPES
jgi:tripartite-type tricarboxylate transporter receptor subunit TctC